MDSNAHGRLRQIRMPHLCCMQTFRTPLAATLKGIFRQAYDALTDHRPIGSRLLALALPPFVWLFYLIMSLYLIFVLPFVHLLYRTTFGLLSCFGVQMVSSAKSKVSKQLEVLEEASALSVANGSSVSCGSHDRMQRGTAIGAPTDAPTDAPTVAKAVADIYKAVADILTKLWLGWKHTHKVSGDGVWGGGG